MGLLSNGTWKTDAQYADEDGEFKRAATTLRGELGSDDHPAGAGRYHLYVSYACPWAHRTLIARALKGLEGAIDVSVVDPFMGDDGWSFSTRMGCAPDPVLGADYLRELYLATDEKFTGRVTVPALWDKETKGIVNNESKELLRMFDRAFAPLATREVSLWPEARHDEIDAMIEANYNTINNGVYRAGFATSQHAYDAAVSELFGRLEACEQILTHKPFLCGEKATAADICLFTTLLRFEPVYHYHFKCNLRRLRDFPHLWEFTRALYQVPAIRETCRIDHIKLHYFMSHPFLNPSRIIPAGPLFDLEEPVSAARQNPF